MECLVRRDDNTLAYIHKMHNYNPKVGTPRPIPKYKSIFDIKKKEETENYNKKTLIEILELFYN